MAELGTTSPSMAAELLDALARRTAHGLADRAASFVPRASFRATELVLPIPPLVRGNPELAAAMYRGQFTLAGQTVNVGNRMIFELGPQSPSFDAALYSFDWLKHLEACGSELARIQGRALLADWIRSGIFRTYPARDLAISARRTIAWVRHAAFFLKGADAGFSRMFFQSLNRQGTRLARAITFAPASRGRLEAAIALAYMVASLGGLEKMRSEILERLGDELSEQILPDGGHVSRNPAATVELLLDLIPLRDTLHANKLETPAAFDAAVERMVPFLRLMLHGDGGIAVFNGVSDTLAGSARAVIDADDVRGKPITLARHSGYARLAYGRSTILVDVGRPPAPGLNPAAQSGPLALEFSDGPHRIVVNCGTPPSADPAWMAASRLTVAHSTATVGGRSASRIIDSNMGRLVFGAPAMFGPQTVDGELTVHETGSVLEAYHNGYLSAFGCLHERRLFLARHGADFRGEDRFLATPEGNGLDTQATFDIRFHFHPSVRVVMTRGGQSVNLILPNRVAWRFSARGATMQVLDSVYLPGSPQPRRTHQIVLSGTLGQSTSVKWAFRRLDQPAAAPGAEAESGPSSALEY